jgi:hypothetical protein
VAIFASLERKPVDVMNKKETALVEIRHKKRHLFCAATLGGLKLYIKQSNPKQWVHVIFPKN